METNWVRLGHAIREARHIKGMTQEELADLAQVSRRSLMSLERGHAAKRIPPSLAKVAAALGWPAGHGEAMLTGRDDIPDEAFQGGTGFGLVAYRPAPQDPLSMGLPLRVTQELASGVVVDTDVIEFGSPGSGTRMVIIVKRDEDAPLDGETLREQMRAWGRVQQILRAIADQAAGL